MMTAMLICAVVPAVLFSWNLILFREPPPATGHELPVPVSVLIPARNEECCIRDAVESVLASREIDLEVIVLDDASDDRTAEIVGEIAARDGRVRVEHAPSLPRGWNGKQHACYVLASLARHDVFCFMDADVRLAPLAIARMTMFLDRSRADLVSGFPRQETVTWLERLLLPLIHFVLLGYLPFVGMRRAPSLPGFAAGCGQFLMVRRNAYEVTGGHREIRTTMHDGLLLPTLFRRHGFRTDLADLTRLASCRMYRSTAEVWRGLTKNATEGIATTGRILPFTFLLFFGQVLPFALLPAVFTTHDRTFVAIAIGAAYLPRFVSVYRFRQDVLSAILHPLGIVVLLLLQWFALVRKLVGVQATWKQRAYRVG
jgi:glycosyltransferase involved in cell wall biosynthesis